MEIMMPILLVFIFAGFFLYNPIRKKWRGIVGVGSSYLLACGILVLVGLIVSIFVPEAREYADGGVAGVILYLVVSLAAVAYLAFLMLTRCKTVKQRILLPFVVLIIAFGFATRMLANIVFHLPMERGNEDEPEVSFPKYLYDDNNDPWELINEGGDNANYHSPKTGETRTFWRSDFDLGSPSGFHQK